MIIKCDYEGSGLYCLYHIRYLKIFIMYCNNSQYFRSYDLLGICLTTPTKETETDDSKSFICPIFDVDWRKKAHIRQLQTKHTAKTNT